MDEYIAVHAEKADAIGADDTFTFIHILRVYTLNFLACEAAIECICCVEALVKNICLLQISLCILIQSCTISLSIYYQKLTNWNEWLDFKKRTMLLASSRKLGGTEQKYTANSTRGGELAGGSLATWASIKEVLRLSMTGTDLGEFNLPGWKADLDH